MPMLEENQIKIISERSVIAVCFRFYAPNSVGITIVNPAFLSSVHSSLVPLTERALATSVAGSACGLRIDKELARSCQTRAVMVRGMCESLLRPSSDLVYDTHVDSMSNIVALDYLMRNNCWIICSDVQGDAWRVKSIVCFFLCQKDMPHNWSVVGKIMAEQQEKMRLLAIEYLAHHPEQRQRPAGASPSPVAPARVNRDGIRLLNEKAPPPPPPPFKKNNPLPNQQQQQQKQNRPLLSVQHNAQQNQLPRQQQHHPPALASTAQYDVVPAPPQQPLPQHQQQQQQQPQQSVQSVFESRLGRVQTWEEEYTLDKFKLCQIWKSIDAGRPYELRISRYRHVLRCVVQKTADPSSTQEGADALGQQLCMSTCGSFTRSQNVFMLDYDFQWAWVTRCEKLKGFVHSQQLQSIDACGGGATDAEQLVSNDFFELAKSGSSMVTLNIKSTDLHNALRAIPPFAQLSHWQRIVFAPLPSFNKQSFVSRVLVRYISNVLREVTDSRQ